ncbi:MAG: hypothetical protein PVJ57_05210 [Phycisphaerae bacterium]|jgi:hypothetical protein
MTAPTTRHDNENAAERAVPAGGDTPETPGPAPTDTDAFALTALLHDLQPHPELDLPTMAYHLHQSDATAADGYGHAAINEARSALEALIVSIARTICHGVTDSTGLRLRERIQAGSTFRTHRRCLMDAGFIDIDENELLQYVYSIASARGSHYGVTDDAWTRLARRIVFIVGQHFTQRYTIWKQNGRQPASLPTNHPQPASRSWPARLLATLLPRRQPPPTPPISTRRSTRRKRANART